LQLPLYWAWNANIRVYTEVGGLLEVWEPSRGVGDNARPHGGECRKQ